jgi:hypothetical protein
MKTASITSEENRTEGQEKQLKRLFEDAVPKALELLLKKVDPDKAGMERLLDNGDEVQDAIVDAILEQARKHASPNEFANEQVASNYGYPPEYKGPRPIKEQIEILAKIFGLDPSHALEYAEKIIPTLTLRNGMEGWFAVLSPSALEKLFPQVLDEADRFCNGVNLVLEKIGSSRTFHNYWAGKIDTKHIRQHVRTTSAVAKIAEVQKGDILIIQAQLGLRYRGCSVRRARVCFRGGEFGLDPISMGSITLTHPERYVRSSELDTDLPGAEFSPDGDGDFSGAPVLGFGGGRVGFNVRYVGNAGGGYGSASGASPQ